MPQFKIVEIDNDYRAWTGTEIREFPDLKTAEKYANEKSWSGYHYFVDNR
jgi:hypothetical protein